MGCDGAACTDRRRAVMSHHVPEREQTPRVQETTTVHKWAKGQGRRSTPHRPSRINNPPAGSLHGSTSEAVDPQDSRWRRHLLGDWRGESGEQRVTDTAIDPRENTGSSIMDPGIIHVWRCCIYKAWLPRHDNPQRFQHAQNLNGTICRRHSHPLKTIDWCEASYMISQQSSPLVIWTGNKTSWNPG